MRRFPRPSRSTALLLLGIGFALLPIGGSAADRGQEGSGGGFDERQRLTAVDVLVGFTAGGFRGWATDPAPRFPDPGDFEVRVDDVVRPVISVGRDPSWEVVLWFQSDRSRTALLRRGAVALAARASELTALGPVDVVVAEPAPSRVARDVGSPEALKSVLGELARTLEGRDEIVGLRDEVRRELAAIREDGGRTGMTPAELVGAARAEEVRIVRTAHDHLALDLAGRSGTAAGKLLVLVAGGVDLDPSSFWSGWGEPVSGPGLDRPTEELGRLLASYGWVVVALDPEPEEPLRDGWTIGKWRSAGLGVEQKTFWDPVFGEEHEQTLIGWRWKRESQRKPERAEAFLQLGESLRAGGDFEDAVEAFRDALYHFAGHRKTAERQAVAFLGLGKSLEALGDLQEARTAFRLGRSLDPELARGEIGPPIDVRAPRAALERLAADTAGALVEEPEDLERALRDLGHRLRVTYQLEGWPDGTIHPLSVALVGPWAGPTWRDPEAPTWTRRSTPEILAEARLRLALDGIVQTGSLRPEIVPGADGGFEVRVDPDSLRRPEGREEVRWRLSLAVAGPSDGAPRIEHRLGEPEPLTDDGPWRTALEGVGPASSFTVLVEDLASGAWGLSAR